MKTLGIKWSIKLIFSSNLTVTETVNKLPQDAQETIKNKFSLCHKIQALTKYISGAQLPLVCSTKISSKLLFVCTLKISRCQLIQILSRYWRLTCRRRRDVPLLKQLHLTYLLVCVSIKYFWKVKKLLLTYLALKIYWQLPLWEPW